MTARFIHATFQFEMDTAKRRSAKNYTNPALRLWNVDHRFVDHRVDPGNERLARQTGRRIVEYPHPFIFVRCDDKEHVHEISVESLNRLSLHCFIASTL